MIAFFRIFHVPTEALPLGYRLKTPQKLSLGTVTSYWPHQVTFGRSHLCSVLHCYIQT